MKLSLIVVVLAACLLTNGVVARASQPQLAGFSDFVTGHQSVLDYVPDILKDGWVWTKDQFNDASDWVKSHISDNDIDDLIDKGADLAFKAYVAGAKAYFKQIAVSSHQMVEAGRKLSKGDWKEATKLAIKAGYGLNSAKTAAFKAGLKKGLTGAGIPRAAILLTRIEKQMKAKARAYAKKIGKKF